MGKPSAWDKAFYEKNLQAACRQFSKASIVAPASPSKQAGKGKQQAPPAPRISGLDELGKILQLLKSLLSEDAGVQGKALWVVAQEQLLAAALAWMGNVISTRLVDQAVVASSAAGTQATLQTIMHSMQRLFRIITAMLNTRPDPSGKAVTALCSAAFDCTALDAVASRVLLPMQQLPAGDVHRQYRSVVLGSAINLCSALLSFALHPLMRDSQLQAGVLEVACVQDLIPSLCSLLAHASPAPLPGQGEDKWYEAVTGITIQLVKAAKEGPMASSSLYQQGWQRAILNPMVQEFLLERLIHGLRDASPNGLELPPGFSTFGLLPGLCCPDELQLLPCLLLCLESQWLAWRAAQQQGSEEQQWVYQQADIGQVLETDQLFELTRQVAEQAVLVVTEHVQSHRADNDAESQGVVLDSRMLGALQACSNCLTDLRWLWPALSTSVKQTQLPLMLALAANALAFSSQALSLPVTPGEQPSSHEDSIQGSLQVRCLGNDDRLETVGKTFGRDALPALSAAQIHHARTSTSTSSSHVTQIKATLQECFTRSASVVSFFFPVSKEGAALVGPLPVLYAPPEWPGRLENQISGVIGAIEMALRGEHAPSEAVKSLLLNAVTGILLAAPGSFWTQGQGQECTGMLSTLRKLANKSAAALEDSIYQAQQAEKLVQVAATATGRAKGREPASAATAAAAVDWEVHQHVSFLHRLIMLVVDNMMLLTRPTGSNAARLLDPVFVGSPEDEPTSPVATQIAGAQLSPAITVLMPAESEAGPGGSQPLGPMGPQGRKGRGEANPHGPVPEHIRPMRISEAQLTLRAWLLAELLPTWLRLWNVQLAALAVAVQAELQDKANSSTVMPVCSPSRTRMSQPGPRADSQLPSAESARCQLMRSGLEWLAGIVRAVGPLCSSIMQAHGSHVSGAGSASRGARPDAHLLAVARAAREPVSALVGLDLIPHLRLQVQLEKKRVAQNGVPEGQAGVLHAMAGLLHAQAALGSTAKVQLARAAVEQHLLVELAALYDAQRKSGCRAASSAATMDALQVLITVVQDGVAREPDTPTKRNVEEIRTMMAQLVTAPLPRAEDSDAGFDPQASALADVLIEQSADVLKQAGAAAPAMDGVLATIRLHCGCCNPRCINLSQESEALLPLHMCQ